MSANRIQKIDILRYDPEKDAEPYMQTFEVPFDEIYVQQYLSHVL